MMLRDERIEQLCIALDVLDLNRLGVAEDALKKVDPGLARDVAKQFDELYAAMREARARAKAALGQEVWEQRRGR